jgi:hypothetical protein
MQKGRIFLYMENTVVLFSLYIGILVFISELHSYSILLALSLNRIIAIKVLDCPFIAATFNKFIEGILDQINPWPQWNLVIVINNASIYKSKKLKLIIENQYINTYIRKIYEYLYVLILEACVLFFFLYTHWISIQSKRLSLPSRHGYKEIKTLLWVS